KLLGARGGPFDRGAAQHAAAHPESELGGGGGDTGFGSGGRGKIAPALVGGGMLAGDPVVHLVGGGRYGGGRREEAAQVHRGDAGLGDEPLGAPYASGVLGAGEARVPLGRWAGPPILRRPGDGNHRRVFIVTYVRLRQLPGVPRTVELGDDGPRAFAQNLRLLPQLRLAAHPASAAPAELELPRGWGGDRSADPRLEHASSLVVARKIVLSRAQVGRSKFFGLIF